MKIYIENQILEYENSKDEIDKILNKVDVIINNSSKILSHMIIDDYEVYENFYDYFIDNIRVIEKVEVIFLTYNQLVDDILSSTLNYIERTPDIIENLADKFYKNPDKESWNDLTDLLDGIAWIFNTFSSIDKDTKLKDVVLSYKSWNLYAKEVFALQVALSDFESALSSRDNILIADMLIHEIIPIFNEMKEKLLELVNMEETLNDLN